MVQSAIRRPIVPLFFFDLRTNSRHVVDRDGAELPDLETARTYAHRVARELIFRSEPRKRHWLLVVRDHNDKELFEVPFIAVDDSLRLLNADTRTLLERMCEKRRALGDALFDSRMTVLRARAVVARARSRPYVATENGQTVFSDFRSTT